MHLLQSIRNMKHLPQRVAVLTVTYGERWEFLSQLVEAVMKDVNATKLVIVDNGSKNNQEITEGVNQYGDRVAILRLEKNLGSAGGFAKGIEYMRSVECDFVLMLDDDNVPEEGAIEKFLMQLRKIDNEKVVLVGNRVDIPGNESIFYSDKKRQTLPKETFFESISLEKLHHFFTLFMGKELGKERQRSIPHECVANESFVYGGAFIPIDAIRQAPLPDKNLVLYGDDIEYSWGVKRLGYESYVCYSPKIYDRDMSFGEGSQAVGLFDPKTPPFRVFYRLRNMVLISRRNTRQARAVLFFNIIVWMKAISLLGLFRYGMNKVYFKKLALLYKAVYAGYFPNFKIPKEAHLP